METHEHAKGQRFVRIGKQSARPDTRNQQAPPRMAGNDSITSHKRIKKASIQPPTKPATRTQGHTDHAPTK
jgi:hypothetical protein